MQDKIFLPPEMPIVIRVEKTLVRTDPSLEALIRFLAKRPFEAFRLCSALWKGWAPIAHRIAVEAGLNSSLFPLDPHVIRLAKDRRANVYIVGYADETFVANLAKRIGASGFLASSQDQLVGQEQIADYVRCVIGPKEYAFVGHDAIDVPNWERANASIAVRPKRSLARILAAMPAPFIEISRDQSRLRYLMRLFGAMRSVRGLFAALPATCLYISGSTFDFSAIAASILSVTSLLCASATNEVLSIEADRANPQQRLSALAIGATSLELVLRILFSLAPVLVATLWLIGNWLAVMMCAAVFGIYAFSERHSNTHHPLSPKAIFLDLVITIIGVSALSLSFSQATMLTALCFCVTSFVRLGLRSIVKRLLS